MKCPKCTNPIENDKINIQADIAQCLSCNSVFKISESIGLFDEKFNINEPPAGAWIKNDYDTVIVGATTRSPVAFFLVPFMLIWSGVSLGGIYGSQLLSGEFNLMMSLFGIPFILGSLLFWTFALMAIWGKVELILNKTGGKIFTGLGTIGITRTFEWKDISSIKESTSNVSYPGSKGFKIILEGKKRISFGTGLKESRRYYILKSLQKQFPVEKLNRY